MIDVEIYSDDPDDHVLVDRYWAMNEDGKFKENVSNLLPHKEIKNVHQLTEHISQVSQAWDRGQICSHCEGFHQVFVRADVKRSKQKIKTPCAGCRNLDEKNQHAEKLRLRELLEKLTEDNLATDCEYSEISDDAALILLALHRAINPRLLSGTFMYRDCATLTPSDSDFFIDKLCNSRILLPHYLAAKDGTYSLNGDEIWHYPAQACFFLVPDSKLGKSEIALSILENRNYKDNLALRNLWLDYAVADCHRYLIDQCNDYDFHLEEEELNQMKSIFRTALEIYSVSELWSMVWMIVKDAASLSQKTYSNSRKASATIPGKAQRFLVKVSKGENTLKQWARREQHTEGTLGQVFWDYFSIDAATTGCEVFRIFDVVPSSDNVGPLILPSKELMAKARADGIEAEVLICLAGSIRQGLSVIEAIHEVLRQYSGLGLPQGSEFDEEPEDLGND
ncbi:hypothetical protein [Herminiimonas arsenitoxidans]|uniref:hypothetical protein n=1 Tax=Herminiimonas arsenitoxidans TaxID=1809410 RepID=UPI001E4658F5|nr:hypothetical protein [Herminiimonas arsenitoxidans]